MKAPQQGATRGRSQSHATSIHKIQTANESGFNANPCVVEPASPNPIRVLLVDDHPIVRRGLSGCLAGYKHLLIVGEAGDGQEAIAKTKALSPDVVLMDIEMPKLDGLAATTVLRKENPKSKVLILSMHKDSQYVLRIIRAGAHGYVSKEASPAELVQALETVGAGMSFFGSEVASLALNQMLKSKEDIPAKQLSPREHEVLVAIAEGSSNKEIASRLGLGVRTVETHRERIMRKLNIHSIAGLTRFAITAGLISLRNEVAATSTDAL
jgi:two-component system, NarL family, nitrate/nitrite response regulator NarL